MSDDTRPIGKKADGFPFRPIRNFIFVADYGQPDKSEGGLFLGNFDFGGYRFDLWRYGEVIGIGPGIQHPKTHAWLPMPDVKIGDVVLFSRKHGTRLHGGIRYMHPTIKSREGLLVRVLDPEKTVAVVEDFKPWWDVGSRQLDPGIDFSG